MAEMGLIYADALIQRIDKSTGIVGIGLEPVMAIRDIKELILAMPTVDAEPIRRGRWVKMTGMMPPECHEHYECSECQWHMKGIRNSWMHEEEMSYCPNCGAKMI